MNTNNSKDKNIYSNLDELEKFKKDNENLKRALDNSILGILVSDPDGHITFVNQIWCEMHGYSTDELLGKHIHVFYTDKEYNSRLLPFVETSTKGTVVATEFMHLKKDGEAFPVLLKVTALKDDHDEVIAFSWTSSDLTEQKQHEMELVKRTKELEKLNKVMVNRELRMVEMKKEITELKNRLGDNEE